MSAPDYEVHPWPVVRMGGQHVGVSRGVLVVHVLTGLAVVEQSERSQMRNVERARARLQALLDVTCAECERALPACGCDGSGPCPR